MLLNNKAFKCILVGFELLCFVAISGLASSVVMNGGQLSDVIDKLKDVLKLVDDQVKISTSGYDTAVIAAQVFSNV